MSTETTSSAGILNTKFRPSSTYVRARLSGERSSGRLGGSRSGAGGLRCPSRPAAQAVLHQGRPVKCRPNKPLPVLLCLRSGADGYAGECACALSSLNPVTGTAYQVAVVPLGPNADPRLRAIRCRSTPGRRSRPVGECHNPRVKRKCLDELKCTVPPHIARCVHGLRPIYPTLIHCRLKVNRNVRLGLPIHRSRGPLLDRGCL